MAAFVMIWPVFFFFFVLMVRATPNILTTYVASSFQQHSLTHTFSIMSSIISGVLKLTIAKVFDVLGRPQGFLLAIVSTTIGLATTAACTQVKLHAAAHVLSRVGKSVMLFTLIGDAVYNKDH